MKDDFLKLEKKSVIFSYRKIKLTNLSSGTILTHLTTFSVSVFVPFLRKLLKISEIWE